MFCKNIINDLNCQCGSLETTKHYLFECQRYYQIREEMLNEISRYCTPSLNILLFGDEHLNYNNNLAILLLNRSIFLRVNVSSLEDLSFSLSLSLSLSLFRCLDMYIGLNDA